VRHLYRGDFYPLGSYSTAASVWMAWQVHRADLGEGLIQAFRRQKSPESTATYRLHGLELATEYVLTNLDDPKPCRMTGRDLMERGLTIHLAGQPNAAIFMYKKAERLFVARPLTAEGSFTAGVEGPACDQRGDVFAVNFQREGTIGRITPDGKAEVFVELPAGSVGNGIRFDRQGLMYVADYPRHNVLRVDPKSRSVSVFAHEERMNQPNDLAIGPDETLYASDPNWKQGTGQLWRIDRSGKVTPLATDMGTTNGIEVSPDGRTLYVNETVQRKVWSFTITAEHALAGKRLLIEFPDFGMDGMRCDVDGNLYVTRHGKGTVVKVTPEGKVTREIDVLGKMPSNICFGGPDGRTAYVTEMEHRRLVEFRVDRPGSSWKRWLAR
jgi:sugar lactone lactonase YvrE